MAIQWNWEYFLSSDAVAAAFCEMLEDFCGRAEIFSDERDDREFLPMSAADIKVVLKEITSIRAKKALQLVPVDNLVKLLRVLDYQIHRAEGLSINDCEHVSNYALHVVLLNFRYR